MPFSHLLWTRRFKTQFAPQLSSIVDAVEQRILPAFQGIEEEAEAFTEERWKEFMSMPAMPDVDPADLAEAAQEAGVSHYLLLTGMRQGLLNLCAVALHHTFEQQVMLFHRRQVLHPSEENNPSLFSMTEFQKRLARSGIDITAFSSWSRMNQLRLVANTAKHAEGDSARKLYEQRPDLFEHPQLPQTRLFLSRGQPRVFLPLVGEDLYLSMEDLRQYRDAAVQYWEELASAMERI